MQVNLQLEEATLLPECLPLPVLCTQRSLFCRWKSFTWVCWTVSLIFYTLVLFLSKGEQHSAFFCTLILVLFPKHFFKNRNTLSQTCQIFFFHFLNDSWNFTSYTKYFYLIKDMDFPAAQNWQQKTNFFSWFSETSVWWVCSILFMCQKRKQIWNEFLKYW